MSEITYSELMSELDKYKVESAITPEQLEFLKKARSKNIPGDETLRMWNSVSGWKKYKTYQSLYKLYKDNLK